MAYAHDIQYSHGADYLMRATYRYIASGQVYIIP